MLLRRGGGRCPEARRDLRSRQHGHAANILSRWVRNAGEGGDGCLVPSELRPLLSVAALLAREPERPQRATTTILPSVWPASTWATASRASPSGYVRPMTGRIAPAATSP